MENSLLLNPDEFKTVFKSFRKIDYQTYPFCFGEFWKWKLETETKSEHILDADHIEETYDKLSKTLKIWQWHRPYSFASLAKRLKNALERISDVYSKIRSYSLLEFREISDEPLRQIWHELGCVKNGGEKNSTGYYLVMATTKPLMFLWGQTLAFDTVVRGCMPRFNITGLGDNYWSFGKWKEIMGIFQESLNHQTNVLDIFREAGQEEYGTSSFIPYGQFLDCYYWRTRQKCRRSNLQFDSQTEIQR